MSTEPTPTPPSSPAPAAPSPSAAAPAVTPAATPASTPTPTTPTPTAPSRPDWLPEKFFDATKGPNLDEFGKHYAEVATRDAAEQVRRAALPQKPEDVKLELPKDFKLPEGVEFKVDPTKPEYSKLQQLAVKHGWSQDTTTDVLAAYAETLVGDAATTKAAHDAEIAKAGANGPARVTALGTWLNSVVGEELGKHMSQFILTAKMIEGLERLSSKFQSQGVASFSQAHRDTPNPQGKVSQEQFDKMSPAARLDYTRQFDQSQFQKSA